MNTFYGFCGGGCGLALLWLQKHATQIFQVFLQHLKSYVKGVLEGLSVERGSLTHNCVTIWISPHAHLCEVDTMMAEGVDPGASLPGFECWLGSFWSVWPEASDEDSLFSYLRKRGNNRRQLRKSKCVKTLAQCLPHGRCSKMFIILNICVEREEILVRGREIQNWRISLFTRVITTAWCWG